MSVIVEDLTVRYGDLTAVDDVSFIAPAGEVTVILGPNGAGKTSTIEVCEGFRPPVSGTVRVLGLDPVADHAALTERMGVMLQGGGVYPSARIADVVAHFCALYGKGVDPVALVDLVGLSSRGKSTWRKLSGGEQQRLCLALALAGRPDVVFLDEPTSGVDIDGRDVIRTIIDDLAARGATVVLASHDMSEAERVATNVVMFKAGRVVAAGPLESMLGTRRHLRFTTRAGLSTVEIAAVAGSPTKDLGAGVYEVASEATPQLIGRITAWLSSSNLPLVNIDMGQETLEDAYRRLTGGAA